MIWLLCVQVVFGANQWEGQDSSVEVSRLFRADGPSIYAQFDELEDLSTLYPERCVNDWVITGPNLGGGARGEVTYRLEKFRRRLTVVIAKAEPGRYVELDHLSSKGFITRWLIEQEESGQRVTLKTFINAPPWPFKAYYFNKIKPAWLACYEETLDRLGARLESVEDQG